MRQTFNITGVVQYLIAMMLYSTLLWTIYMMFNFNSYDHAIANTSVNTAISSCQCSSTIGIIDMRCPTHALMTHLSGVVANKCWESLNLNHLHTSFIYLFLLGVYKKYADLNMWNLQYATEQMQCTKARKMLLHKRIYLSMEHRPGWISVIVKPQLLSVGLSNVFKQNKVHGWIMRTYGSSARLGFEFITHPQLGKRTETSV